MTRRSPLALAILLLGAVLPSVPLAAAASNPTKTPPGKKKSGPAPDTVKTSSGRDIGYNAVTDGPRSPAEQRLAFKVAAGFEIELVAAESPGFGKFINVDWDARMRLWTMTALEYPVDGNESQAAADALYARGGRDRAVVYDAPYGAPPSPGAAVVSAPPRIFADGLVMPLGLLPLRDGALVQYGSEVRRYRDNDGDGRADGHEVVLTGFGTQDSHLFPHQFLRQPGGDFFLAQGLFNYSTVRRPHDQPFADGAVAVPFNQCKLARVALDGSRFEAVTAGPNNIWGLVTSRDGETFLQEANDQGYPVIPYTPGIHVRTGSREKLKPYQPLMPPPLAPAQMGGTGLSGLALAEDRGTPFRAAGGAAADADRVFFLANPITGAINVVRGRADATGTYRFEKQPDFITTGDRWFRPIAVHFGPDGALYIVDWYNRIISHNEVPRDHPDRDKARGRIWRVRHRDQPRVVPPDLTRLSERDLVARLGDANARVSRLAWLELADRGRREIAPELRTLVLDRGAPDDRRLAALWALESLAPADTPLLAALAADGVAALRREAARLAAAHPRPEGEFAALLAPLIADTQAPVRAAAGDALRRVRTAGPATLALIARLGRDPLAGNDVWARYHRDFERYLARWAFETFPAATRDFLASDAGRSLPRETRLLATLALEGPDAARGVAALAPSLGRALVEDEIGVLAADAGEPEVRSLLDALLQQPAARPGALRALLALRTRFEPAPLRATLTAAVVALLAAKSPADQQLGAEAAGAFQLTDAEPALRRLVEAGLDAGKGTLTPTALAALRSLGETGGADPATCEPLLRRNASAPVRDAAIHALATSRAPEAPARLVSLLGNLGAGPRGRAIERLTRTPAGARALLAGRAAGTVNDADLGFTTVDRLHALLPDDPDVTALWLARGGDRGDTPPVLTAAEQAAEAERFARFRALANTPGDPARGRTLFTAICLSCHQQGGQGGQIGPALDGLGHTGVEAILRNVLTPSAAMESAYRTYRVITRDGAVVEGFLASETPEAVVLRIPGAAEQRIPRANVRESGYLRRSLMPEGLLEALPPAQVSDLFTHLKSLR